MPRLGDRKLSFLLKDKLSTLKEGRDKLFRILRANHMLITLKKRYHITTNSHHHFRKHENLRSSIKIQKPDAVWVRDITYVGTRDNLSYLTLITNAYAKNIVAYSTSNSLSMKESLKALRIALSSRKNKNQPSNTLLRSSAPTLLQ